MGDIKPVAWIDAEDLARLRCGITRDVKTATVYSASMGGGCARLYDEATVAGLIVESDGWKQQVMDEMTANLEFRAAGGAMPGEDMPTFCKRLIAERDALRAVIGFFASVIKSGEPWTDQCQREYDAAMKGNGNA